MGMPPSRAGEARAWIPGVRRVSWDTGEMCEFAACLVSAMQCLDRGVPYCEVMAACGAAFRFTLSPDHWNPGNYALENVTPDDREPVERAFRWVGRAYTWLPVDCGDQARAAVVHSIDRGVPVLARGVVGPADYTLITGYDDAGDVVLGWSTYQDIPADHDVPPDETGYFRKPGWQDNTRHLILLGGEAPPPPRREGYLGAMRWAVSLVHQGRAEGWSRGLTAYDDLAADVLDDSLFPAGDTEALGWRYLSLLCDMMMVDDRRAAAEFMRQVGRDEPELARHADAAAECYEATAAARNDARATLPEDFSPDAIARLSSRAVREAYAQAIRRMRAADERAIRHIAHCLADAGG